MTKSTSLANNALHIVCENLTKIKTSREQRTKVDSKVHISTYQECSFGCHQTLLSCWFTVTKTRCCLPWVRNTSLEKHIGMHITVTRDCKDESGQQMVERKEVWSRRPNRSTGASSALRRNKLRTELLEHHTAMLRENRAIELAQLPIYHAHLCAVVGAVHIPLPRARQNRGVSTQRPSRPRSLPPRLPRPDHLRKHSNRCFPLCLLRR